MEAATKIRQKIQDAQAKAKQIMNGYAQTWPYPIYPTEGWSMETYTYPPDEDETKARDEGECHVDIDYNPDTKTHNIMIMMGSLDECIEALEKIYKAMPHLKSPEHSVFFEFTSINKENGSNN